MSSVSQKPAPDPERKPETEHPGDAAETYATPANTHDEESISLNWRGSQFPLPDMLLIWCVAIQIMLITTGLVGQYRALPESESAELPPLEEISITDLQPAGEEPTNDATENDIILESEPELPEEPAEPIEPIEPLDVAEVVEPMVPQEIDPAAITEPLPLPPESPPESPPQPSPTPRPTPSPSPPPADRPPGTPGETGEPVEFTGAGTGRFPLPPYPRESRRLGQEGRVVLLVEVGANGRVQAATIDESSGHAVLDRTARDWIRQRWSWEPGNPRRFLVPVDFQLE